MNGKEFFRKSQFVLLIALGCYPAAIMAALFIEPKLLDYSWIYPLVYGISGIGAMMFPGKPRLIWGIVGCLLLTVPCFLFLESSLCAFGLLIGVIFCGLLLCTMRMGAWEAGKELPAGWLAVLLVFLLFGCFLSFVEERVAHTGLSLRICLFVFLFFAMRSLNRGSLFLAAGGKRSFSPAMVQKNTMMTVILFFAALALALLPSAWELLKLLFELLGRLFAWLKDLFAAMMPEETISEATTIATTEVATTGEGLGVLTEKIPRREPSAAGQAMMTTVVLMILIPASIFGLYNIVRLLIKGVRKLIDTVDAAVNAHTDDYEDEITDTRQDGESETRKDPKEKKPKIPESSMEPGERIRYRYRKLSKKHPEWQASNTARENLPATPAGLYERARYSTHPITPEEAEQFKSETK